MLLHKSDHGFEDLEESQSSGFPSNPDDKEVEIFDMDGDRPFVGDHRPAKLSWYDYVA